MKEFFEKYSMNCIVMYIYETNNLLLVKTCLAQIENEGIFNF